MDFEHIIQINDTGNPLIERLSREQLWQGLVLRARHPEPFMVGLDRCVLLETGDNYLKRELHFGRHVFVDHVSFEPGARVRYVSDAAGTHAGSELVVTIEEPEPASLFVRFRYHTVPGEEAADPQADAFRRSAYRDSDIQAIAQIRQFASEGLLGT